MADPQVLWGVEALSGAMKQPDVANKAKLVLGLHGIDGVERAKLSFRALIKNCLARLFAAL